MRSPVDTPPRPIARNTRSKRRVHPLNALIAQSSLINHAVLIAVPASKHTARRTNRNVIVTHSADNNFLLDVICLE